MSAMCVDGVLDVSNVCVVCWMSAMCVDGVSDVSNVCVDGVLDVSNVCVDGTVVSDVSNVREYLLSTNVLLCFDSCVFDPHG